MISVVIATYNYGKYLSDAISSLQDQQYQDWECIVVDDGSKDNTAAIISNLQQKDARIKYFKQDNSGPSVARNTGLDLSTGNYVLFLDADDLLQPNKLKSHWEVLDKNQDVDIAYGDVRYFNDGDKSNLFYSLNKKNRPWIPKYKGNGRQLVNMVLKQNIMVTSSPLYRKKLFDDFQAYDPKLLKLEDWELFQRLALKDLYFYFVNAEDSLVLMRAHESSYSFDKRGMRSYFLPILEKHFIKSKLNFSSTVYVSARILEEFADTALYFFITQTYPPRHYFSAAKFILPVLLILLFPFYMIIKILRLLQKAVIKK